MTTTLQHLCADFLEIWEPQPPGILRVCPGLYRDCFTFTFYILSIFFFSQLLINVENVSMDTTVPADVSSSRMFHFPSQNNVVNFRVSHVGSDIAKERDWL